MTARARCPRGHFLPAAGVCRCIDRLSRAQRASITADLWGQGRRIRDRDLTTVPLTGAYL
ncbi:MULTISPECIES: hypothetical protein [Streptomyces]|uniref:hypothetical protein n=1 Tax=Streptomyces TaxID=1883 RepID=UPI00073DDF4C|nr:hypothetical protein [Streptomyces sp. FBKL.4005]MYU28625.1 hypothetical protein [Streptomyces sp. SID7810]OYP17025.1 hypothetical protein CFC35_23035 [Streptomyces sp. FBKL.4005]CUW29664.1 hypothetical protein TUE45_04373 [Streptomyces reticuli]